MIFGARKYGVINANTLINIEHVVTKVISATDISSKQ